MIFLFLSLLACAENVRIDHVEIEGSRGLESALKIHTGDELAHQKIVETEENMSVLLQRRGYENARIETRLVRQGGKNSVHFVVHEGLPVRILSCNVHDASLASIYGIREGDLLDQDALVEAKKRLEEALVKQHFVTARVESVVLKPVSAKRADASRLVTLDVLVTLGDRVYFGFRGNRLFTAGELNDIVGEEQHLGLGGGYERRIARRIEDEYARKGYISAKVTLRTRERESSRSVIFIITEGKQASLVRVSFHGMVALNEKELREQWFSYASRLLQNGIYSEKDARATTDLLVEKIRSQGYLSVRLVAMTPEVKDLQVTLSIFLYEGTQTRVAGMEFTGFSVVPDCAKVLGLEKGAPLNLAAFTEGLESLKKFYRDKGFLDAAIEGEGRFGLIRYESDNRQAFVQIRVNEGQEMKLTGIQIIGLEHTHEEIVRAEIKLKPGDTVREFLIQESENQLRRMGFFSSVNIQLEPDGAQGRKLIVRLTEGDRGIVSWGPGYRNDLGIRTFGQLSYANLWGRDHLAALNVSMNRRFYNYHFSEGQAQFLYVWKNFLAHDVTLRPMITYAKTQYLNFSVGSLNGNVVLSAPLRSHLMGYLGYTLERIDQFAAVRGSNNGQFTLSTLTPKLVLDMRDNSLVPNSGFSSTLSLDVTPSILGSIGSSADGAANSPLNYYRVQLRHDFYLPLPAGATLYLSARSGFEQTFTDLFLSRAQLAAPIPTIKQFVLGGVETLRGYNEQSYNMQNTKITGSLAFVNYRLQCDVPFIGSLRFGVFIDAGNLLVNQYSLARQLVIGTGFGFHYQTLVGPISLDWGFKVNPTPAILAIDPSPSVVHFSFGTM